MAAEKIRLTEFKAQPVHDESDVYGLDFSFEHMIGDLADTTNLRIFYGNLRVGGSLSETEDIEGTRVRYRVAQIFPRSTTNFEAGEFVMQVFTREALEHKANRAVQKLQEKQRMDAISGLIDAAITDTE